MTPAEIEAGCAVFGAVVILGGIAVRHVTKPIERIAGRADTIAEIVEGTPAKIINGFEVEPRRPGVIERFASHSDQLDRLEKGVAGLYTRVDDLEVRIHASGKAV